MPDGDMYSKESRRDGGWRGVGGGLDIARTQCIVNTGFFSLFLSM